jgi:hypothetical protein
VLKNIKSGSAVVNRGDDLRCGFGIIANFSGPELGILQQPRLDEPQCVGEVATEAPSGVAIHRYEVADFVITESIGVELIDVVAGVIDDELTNVIIPESKRKSRPCRGPDR